MKKLNKILVINKFMISFWNFGQSYYDRGKYNKFYRQYMRLKNKKGIEQYIDKIIITSNRRSIEGIGLLNQNK